MGAFLYSVALLGYGVSIKCSMKVLRFLCVKNSVTLDRKHNDLFCLQAESFCGSEGGEECTDLHRDSAG